MNGWKQGIPCYQTTLTPRCLTTVKFTQTFKIARLQFFWETKPVYFSVHEKNKRTPNCWWRCVLIRQRIFGLYLYVSLNTIAHFRSSRVACSFIIRAWNFVLTESSVDFFQKKVEKYLNKYRENIFRQLKTEFIKSFVIFQMDLTGQSVRVLQSNPTNIKSSSNFRGKSRATARTFQEKAQNQFVYSAFKNVCPTTSICSFLRSFEWNFRPKINFSKLH